MRSCNGWFSGPLGSLSSFRFSLYIQFCLSLCRGGGVAGDAYFLSCHTQTQLNRVCLFFLFCFHFFGVFLASKCQRSTIWLNTSVVSRIARGPRFESRSDHDPPPRRDIWWLIVGWRLGLRASNTTCLVPSGFEDESNKAGSAKWLGSSVGTVLAR